LPKLRSNVQELKAAILEIKKGDKRMSSANFLLMVRKITTLLPHGTSQQQQELSLLGKWLGEDRTKCIEVNYRYYLPLF